MAETITDTISRLTTFIQGVNPTADLSPGSALSELVIKLSATLDNSIYNDIQTYEQTNSVQTALASPTPTITPAIDEVASNYNTTRIAGTIAAGNLKIILSNNQNIKVPKSAQFVQSTLGLIYNTTQDYTFSVNSSTTNNYLPIYTQGNNYYIILPIQASTVGSQYQVSDQTQFTLGSNFTNPNVVSLAAYGNFSSGLPEETDQALIPRFQVALTNNNLTSQNSIDNYLSNNFPGFQAVHVIGANDAEMVRCKENVFGFSTAGMADVYVRTSVGPSTLTVTKAGTKIAAGVWQVNLLTSDCPGFYYIKGILPTPVNNVINTVGTLIINSVEFGYSQINTTRNSQIGTVSDARFSAYQVATVTFQYTENPSLAIGANLDFDFTFFYQPNILPIQQVFLNDGTRFPAADYLIKAVVPCFVNLNINIVRKNITDTVASVGIPNLQQDIFNYINTLDFGQALTASAITNLCYKYPIGYVQFPINMTGNIYGLDGSTNIITSENELIIPSILSAGITPNTTNFFIDYFNSSTGNVTPSNNIVINLL
jgi:hypothetical protein